MNSMQTLFRKWFCLTVFMAALAFLMAYCPAYALKRVPPGAAVESEPVTSSSGGSAEVGPIDGRDIVAPNQFEKVDEKQWVTDSKRTHFEFDELIYSWVLDIPENEGFRLYLQVGFEDGTESPWLYAGYWGEVPLVESRENPEFEFGRVAMDQLLLGKKARSYQFKVVDEGKAPLTQRPMLYVIYTDNNPTAAKARKFKSAQAAGKLPEYKILDLPYRRQADSAGNYIPDKCQSAALATALSYFGKEIPLEDIIPWTHDPEYNYPGIWPRTIGAAIQFGCHAYIDRFRDWTAVRAALMDNKVILCSIRMPEEGDYIDPPYKSMGGHIVALNGVTDDGRVVVTDSALGEEKGFRCQWLVEDFKKVWMETKGGVGMVICPPAGAQSPLVDKLEAFPKNRIGEK